VLGPGRRPQPEYVVRRRDGAGRFRVADPGPELYYELLPVHHVAIHGKRGVKIRGLWYDGPPLDGYRDQQSTRGGRHRTIASTMSRCRAKSPCSTGEPLRHGTGRVAGVVEGLDASGR
jgi:hypothetical protein